MNGRGKIAMILFIAVALWLLPVKLFSQKLNAQVSKNKVAVGEDFQLTFTAGGNVAGLKLPNLPDFDLHQGPFQSSSFQSINGNVSQSTSYTYVIAARKEGKFSIGAATATINGTKVESNTISIEVVKGTAPKQQQQQQNDPFASLYGNAQQEEPAKQTASGEDLFMRTYVNKKQCYLGEQITVTQKIYARSNIIHRGPQNEKLPSYAGFWSKLQERKGPLPVDVENLDGINYNVVEYSITYLFPQRAGKITLDPIEVDWVVRVKSKKPLTIFEQFMGGGYQDYAAKLKSKPVVIDVLPLPEKNKPAGFTGAVGKFNFSAHLNHDKVKANEAINLKLTISGTGNITLAEGPKLTFPDGFETYEPKTNETIATNGSVSGTKTYEYLIVPRREGNYVIKDIAFSYFDLEKKQYVTIPSPELKITVEKGDANSSTGASVYSSKNEIGEMENDIRYIKEGDLKLKPLNDEFFGSFKHYAFLVLPLLLFFGFIIGRNQYLKTQSNLVAVKERKAAKLARKQLVLAEKFKAQNKRDEFYGEILTALNKYASNKMNIPVADLSKENISAHLAEKKVNTETISKLMNTLNDCEYVRYAPASVEQDLNIAYNNTIELITKIEDEIK